MTTYYRVGLAQMASPFVDFDGDTIRVAFLTSTYTLDKETHEFWSDVSANEISAGGGYTAGGIALSSKTATRVSNVITFDAAESGGTEMVIRTHFDSLAGMEYVPATGVEEGMAMVIDQIDAALAGAAT